MRMQPLLLNTEMTESDTGRWNPCSKTSPPVP
jgi:hypothetical protein